MGTKPQLKPAKALAAANGIRFPNESDEYRRARDALLAEEIELRRHIEQVAEQRRSLPANGPMSSSAFHSWWWRVRRSNAWRPSKRSEAGDICGSIRIRRAATPATM